MINKTTVLHVEKERAKCVHDGLYTSLICWTNCRYSGLGVQSYKSIAHWNGKLDTIIKKSDNRERSVE